MKLVLIGAGLIAAVLAVTVMAVWRSWAKKDHRAEISISAKVRNVEWSGQNEPMVCFETQNGLQRLEVPAELAQQLVPGEYGVLTHQGDRFIYFVSKKQLREKTETLAQVS